MDFEVAVVVRRQGSAHGPPLFRDRATRVLTRSNVAPPPLTLRRASALNAMTSSWDWRGSGSARTEWMSTVIWM
jgi:hypothetical protein